MVCGIAGFERHLAESDLRKFEPVLKHRGPDYTGYYQDEEFSFIHWRLAIIDLSDNANQPYCFENLVLLFNGELFNYREVSEELKQYGYEFVTNSDTEVLIKAFHCWKTEAIKKFIGMFSFSLYDTHSKEIFLYRDRVGVKPLYFSLKRGLSFASELRMLKCLLPTVSIDNVALHQYFRFGYVPGDRTIFSEIKKLRPGQFLKYHKGVTEIRTWWSPFNADSRGAYQLDNPQEELEKLLVSAFKYRMVADVPVGIFLSGGIDSSLLATLLQHHSSQKIQTFTIGFDDEKFDETKYAKQVAQRLNTQHVDLRLGIRQAEDLFNGFYDVYDEPFSDTSGIPMALVSQLAKANGVKVVLSADGADELFGGYAHYIRINRWINLFNTWPAWMRKLSGKALKGFVPPWVRSNLSMLNLEHRISRLEELLQSPDAISFYESAISNQSQGSVDRLIKNRIVPVSMMVNTQGYDQEKMMNWDLQYYLPDDLLMKVDRATMYSSIEGREPFLDHRVVEFSKLLPLSSKIDATNTGKAILRKILYKYHPAELFDRPKQGFSIPIFNWFNKRLDEYFRVYLSKEALSKTEVLDSDTVQTEMRKYLYYKQRGKDYNIEKMWRILSFMMWKERWMK
ncbi:MAG: asparagine synthase (glutamine-hydrolyzing) [Cyclobacteriaceae bacterium]|nr:MAG: asparagine synthase (glutamine-hydrolyzing) [Cyclobacteriaceae bacterium]